MVLNLLWLKQYLRPWLNENIMRDLLGLLTVISVEKGHNHVEIIDWFETSSSFLPASVTTLFRKIIKPYMHQLIQENLSVVIA